MKTRKPLEPILPGVTDFRPRLARFGNGSDLPALAAIKKAIGTKTRRSNTKGGWKGSGRIRPQRGFQQRVVVKARVVKMNNSSKAKKNLRAHVQYLVRSGVSKAGESPSFFNSDQTNTKKDINEQIKIWGEDKHHFRFIISPEKGHELDLEEYTREVIKGFENDLNEKLTWFATCHYNTDEPHIHLVVRGVGEDGNTLSISKDYIRHGLRELAQKVATKRIGERSELDLKKELSHNVTALKWTSLDSSIEKEMNQSPDSCIRLYKGITYQTEVSKIYKELKLQRLQFLNKHDLSREVTPGVWKLSSDAKTTLIAHAKLDKVNKLVSKHLEGREVLSQLVLHEKAEQILEPIRGEVLGVGFQDGHGNNKYVIVSGLDGRNHFIEPSRFSVANGTSIKEGQLVKVYCEEKPHLADVVIKRFSGQKDGIFDEKQFQEYVQTSVGQGTWQLPQDVSIEDYLERYRTRINSLEDTGIIKSVGQRRFSIPQDIHEQVGLLDKKLGRAAHVTIEVESYLTLKQQVKYEGATWLDIPNQIGDGSKLSALGIKISTANQDRQDNFSLKGVSEERRTFKELEAFDQSKLKETLKLKYGSEVIPVDGQQYNGVVKRYKILGTGIHEIIKTKDGFFVRKLKTKESLLPIGSAVQFERTRGGSRVRKISSGENAKRSKGKGR
ncbi:MAG TPA: DUF3363 domain-containing protein [Oligoflexia bacterium]|nr:DUF3363 domain-containing protein [Oligoflexia bacterium]HMP49741.1 DUF3363 domain-containing protein [Oligoflexia bacterium]